MTLDEAIELFKRIENGEEGQAVNFQLHAPINYVNGMYYGLHNEKRFSNFLQQLKEHEPV